MKTLAFLSLWFCRIVTFLFITFFVVIMGFAAWRATNLTNLLMLGIVLGAAVVCGSIVFGFKALWKWSYTRYTGKTWHWD